MFNTSIYTGVHRLVGRARLPVVIGLICFSADPYSSHSAEEPAMTVLFGTYAQGEEQGIYASSFDPATGHLGEPRQVAKLPNPGFLAVAPDDVHVYAVGRGATAGPMADGRIAALAMKRDTAQLTLINELATQGKGPCHVAIHPNGRFAGVADYGSGSIEVFAIDAQGALQRQVAFVAHQGSSVDTERQEGPHAHSIHFTPDGQLAVVADLGLDKVLVYKFDSEGGALVPADPPAAETPPGAGPRHLAFHPGGRLAFVLNEMGGTITSLRYERESGRLTSLGTTDAMPEGYQGNRWSAEIAVHPGGKTIYCSHRGNNTIATLAIEGGEGRLRLLDAVSSGGVAPRNFGLDPSGRWILSANQEGNNVIVLKIDPVTGLLTPTGQEIQVPAPVCVRFL